MNSVGLLILAILVCISGLSFLKTRSMSASSDNSEMKRYFSLVKEPVDLLRFGEKFFISRDPASIRSGGRQVLVTIGDATFYSIEVFQQAIYDMSSLGKYAKELPELEKLYLVSREKDVCAAFLQE